MLGRAETSTSAVPIAANMDPTMNTDAVLKTITTAAHPWKPTTTLTPVTLPVTPPLTTTTAAKTTRRTTTAAEDDHHRNRTRSQLLTISALSWPSSDWILETVEQIEAANRARGIRAGGATGVDPFDYDDGGDNDDDDNDGDDKDDKASSGDEIEEIEEPTTTAPATVPPPPSPRVASGHMSRYLFRRIDGRPGDGRVNGTYVAVVESNRPPRGIVYDPVSKKKPLQVRT